MSRGLEASEDRLGNSTSSSMITCMCWHPQMKILAVARDDSSIVVYSCASSSWCAKLDNCPYGDEITSMCFHPTEPLLFAIVKGGTNPPLLTIWSYAPRKYMKVCEVYHVHQLAEGLSPTAVPSLSCHPRENVIMLSFPDGRVLGLSLWDKYSHLGRGMTSASPRQVPFRAFYQGTTEETMAPLTLPLIHYFTNYELELKNNKPVPRFMVKYRGMREKWSHYLIELASAVRSADNEAIVVRCDGLKVSEDGQDVILFMRPEASEKPRKRVLLPGVDDSSPDFDPDNDENYLYIPVEGDDERRFFIFLSAKKGCEMIKNWEERDPEEELEEGAEEQFYSRLLYTKMPKEESCQDALPLNNGLWA